MNIYSHDFHRQLSLLDHLQSLKETFDSFKETREAGLAYYMSRSTEPKHIQSFSVSHFSFTGVAFPSTDTTTILSDMLNFYKEQAGRFFTQSLPHAQVRINDLTISIRISKAQLTRADKVLQAFRDDAYWNDYFTKNDPELTKLLNSYSSSKQAFDRYLRNNTVKQQEQNGFIYFRIPFAEELVMCYLTTGETSNMNFSRIREIHSLPRSYESSIHSHMGSHPMTPDMAKHMATYLLQAFLLDELYDYVKLDMESHYAQLHDKMDHERKEAFQRLENWYRSTHVDHEAKTFTPLFADNHLASLPEKMELFLYSSNENHEWVARLIQPTSENPLLDGHAAPVIGSFTKTVNETGRITVNDYFDVQLDLEAARATWLEHTDIEHSLTLDGYTPSSSVNLDAFVDEAPPEVETTDTAEPVRETMKTVTLEELFRQHGVELPQQEQAPSFEEVEDPHAERPDRYRITKVGNHFNLLFNANGNDALVTNLDHDGLRNALRTYNLIDSTPIVVRYDTDESLARSLDRPFTNPSNYLVY